MIRVDLQQQKCSYKENGRLYSFGL